jgi:hypothetical protein
MNLEFTRDEEEDLDRIAKGSRIQDRHFVCA